LFQLNYLFTDPTFVVDVNSTRENLIVGSPYKLQCEVHTDQMVHFELVNINWIGPNNDTVVINDRINITQTNSIGKSHTSTLEFLYLSDVDEGLYTCNVDMLQNKKSKFFELKGAQCKFNFTLVNLKMCDGNYKMWLDTYINFKA